MADQSGRSGGNEGSAELAKTADERAYREERDDRDNKKTTPPQDERVWTPTIWVIEAFTPPLIHKLEEGANRLAWTADGHSINEDFLSKIGEMRSAAGSSGWVNVGYVVAPTNGPKWPFQREAPLPPGVQSLRPTLIQPFSSTTLLCCQFVLDEHLAKSIEEPLRATYKTQREQLGGKRYRQWTVEHVKEREVQTSRAYVRSVCTAWVREYFPGFFASSLGGEELPTFELVLFAAHEEFSVSTIREQPEWLRLLGCEAAYDNWKCEEASLYMSLGERRGASRAVTVFGNVRKIAEGKDLAGHGSDSADQVVNWMSDFDRTFATLALSRIGDALVLEMARLRDEFGELDMASDSTVLWQWERRLSQLQRTALPFVADIKGYCKHEPFFLHDLYEFQEERTRGDPIRLFRGLRWRLKGTAKAISQGERQLRAIAAQAGRLLSSISNEKVAATNIRLQRAMLLLTIVILALTFVTALEPFSKLVPAPLRSQLSL
jgi:hypothetical protein